MTTALHIDWLALQYEGVPRDCFPFKVKKLSYGSKEFKELYEITYYDRPWASLSTQPALPSLPGNFYLLKISNDFCYDTNLCWQLESWKEGTKSKYLGVSRVDLCLDFNDFDGEIRPAELIRMFGGGEIDSLSKMKGQVFRGKDASEPYESMSLGSRTSNVRVYLYNKTKEMQDNVMKPWIIESDKRAGLDVARDIWRLEISLKSQALKYVDKCTGEEFTLDYDRLCNQERLKKIMGGLVDKYFKFIPSSCAKNRYKNKVIELLPLSGYVLKTVNVRTFEDSSRSDRIFIKKFLTESLNSPEIDEQDRWHLASWIYHWAKSRNLESYLLSLKKELNL